MESFSQQELRVAASGGSDPGTEYASSLTSMVMRLPAFDFIEHNSKAYMKIKSEELIFATTSNMKSSQKQIVLIPVDDNNIRLFVIPRDFITDLSLPIE